MADSLVVEMETIGFGFTTAVAVAEACCIILGDEQTKTLDITLSLCVMLLTIVATLGELVTVVV